jgi:hypothetical protein
LVLKAEVEITDHMFWRCSIYYDRPIITCEILRKKLCALFAEQRRNGAAVL